MKIRSALHLNGKFKNQLLFSVLQETSDHLVLKLAACVFFFDQEVSIVQSSQQVPALQGQDFAPDVIAVDEGGQVRLWIECGKTTLHKLEKVTRRFRAARVIILTALPHEGQQMAEDLAEEGLDRVEVWSFDGGEFARWRELVFEQNDIIGESTETSMNLVINGQPFMTEIRKIGEE